MSTEEQEYWEREYAEYEKAALRDEVFWRVPAYALQGSPLFSAFERFTQAFPDHPNDHNTVFYLLDHVRVSPRHYSVRFRCAHFEHDSLEDLRELTLYLTQAAGLISGTESATVELCGEQLQVHFHFPNEGTVQLLQERATLAPAS